MRSSNTRVIVLLAVAAIAACSKKPPETAPAPAINADSVAKARAADSVATVQAAVAKAHADSVATAQAAVAKAKATKDSVKAAKHAEMATTVFFDFDSSVLTDSAKKLLDRKVTLLNANPTVGIQIAGHTDERGSSEYNLALGQRRAAAVKRYLTQHGIADSRITIISLGEERPAAPGHDEASWSKNRRAEFVITIGEMAAES